MGSNRFGSAVQVAFGTSASMAWCQSSGLWEVWGDVKHKDFGKDPIRVASLIGVEGLEGSLGL